MKNKTKTFKSPVLTRLVKTDAIGTFVSGDLFTAEKVSIVTQVDEGRPRVRIFACVTRVEEIFKTPITKDCQYQFIATPVRKNPGQVRMTHRAVGVGLSDYVRVNGDKDETLIYDAPARYFEQALEFFGLRRNQSLYVSLVTISPIKTKPVKLV